jgi:iron complex outermembrane recepter protein
MYRSMTPCLLGSACALLFAQGVVAQEPAERVDEVVVTGLRQAYRGDFEVQEIPQSIAVLDAAVLERNVLLRLTDALDLNASVSRQNNLGGLWDAFAVRGFAGDENLPSGYLVNGFNGGRGFGGTRDVAGLERIEVLKGPTAALFGRGEPGGTINLVTKRPTFADGTRGTVSALYGSFERRRVDADVDFNFAERVGLRLIGYLEDADSFRDTVGNERRGFLPSVSLRVGPQTLLTYDLDLTRQETDFDRGIPTIGGRLDALPRSRFLGEPGDGPTVADVTGHQVQLQHAFSDAWQLLVGGSHRETSLDGFSSDAELVRGRQKLFVDGRSLSRQRRFRDYDSTHSVLRGELAGDFEAFGLRQRVLLGADYDSFENDQVFLRFRPPLVSGNPSDAAANIINVAAPVYGRFPLPTPAPLTNRVDTQRAFGAYLQDQLTLTDRWQLRVGARFDDFTLRSRNRANGVINERSANRVSPQAGVVFQVQPDVSLYAAYGQGFRSNIGADVNGAVFDPEISKSWEAGAKFQLAGGTLSGTVSAFALQKDGVLAADPANPGFSLPIGRAASRGLEIDLSGQLPGSVDVLFSYAYVDAEWRSAVQDANFSLAIRPGDRLINIPEHSLNLQASRAWTIRPGELRLGAGLQYVGDRLGETATTFELPAHTLARLFGSLRLSDFVELTGEVSNLFDETYYLNSFASLWVQPGPPRTGSVGVRVRF